jgi:Protein of unknown function (DUF2934)
MTHSFEQYRHEMIKKLAYEYWERKGRPFGSAKTDWASAEKAIDRYLLASDRNLRLSRFVWDHIKVHFAQRIATHPL